MIEIFKKQCLAAAVALAAACTAVPATAAVTDLPVKNVNGKSYYYYEVQPKETVYLLERKLGIKRDEIYRHNPSARDGLKAFAVLLFPVGQTSGVQTTPAVTAATHKVTRGETVYGISKKYGITKEQIFEWNPSTRDGLKAGQTIYVSNPKAESAPATPAPASRQQPSAAAVQTPPLPAASADPTVTAPAVNPAKPVQMAQHRVAKNETFFSIARAYGVAIDDLEAANPNVGVLREGQLINVPVAGVAVAETETAPSAPTGPIEVVSVTSEPVNDHPVVAGQPVAVEPEPEPETVIVEPVVVRRDTVNIALVLPLRQNVVPQARHNALYTEYLKGFMMAVDSLRTTGTPITVSVFDTYESGDSLTKIMRDPRFLSARLIVAPDNEVHLGRLANYGRAREVFVFNPFVVKDDSFRSNPYMLQANIPQQQMYDKAIDGVITRFADWLPVFVDRQDGSNDKEAFLKAMKERFDKAGIEYREISFENKLSHSGLESLPSDRKLLFIPTSGRQAEANRVLPALADLRTAGRQVRVFGYPEWTTFKGETLENMHALDAVVYSRFFADVENGSAADFNNRFQWWYGQPMATVLPRQGLLGFDSGMYVLRSMLAGNGTFTADAPYSEGLQNGYSFSTPEGAEGMINDVLYFIEFTPDERVERIRL